MRSFVKRNPSRNRDITLSFIVLSRPCPNQSFQMSQICLFTLFGKTNSGENFLIYSISNQIQSISYVRISCWNYVFVFFIDLVSYDTTMTCCFFFLIPGTSFGAYDSIRLTQNPFLYMLSRKTL